MKKDISNFIKVLVFYSLIYIPMMYFIPHSSSFGWFVGIMCGAIGQDIIKNNK